MTYGGTTILTAIRQAVSTNTSVTYSPRGDDLKGADAVVAVVGELSYAETKGGDRKKLNLATNDLALIEKAATSYAPVVTILLFGRPLVLGRAWDASDAFIAA